MVALKKLLDLTGLELSKSLCFWADISIAGQPKSLYARLFLTRNLLRMDRVFAADVNGNYLTQLPLEKLSAHLPVIIEAFQVRSVADMTTLIAASALSADSGLTLSTISTIYRRVLIANVIGVKISLLPNATSLFGDPFSDGATGTSSFMKNWNKPPPDSHWAR